MFGTRLRLSNLLWLVLAISVVLTEEIRSDRHVRHLTAVTGKTPSRLVKRAVNYQSYVCKGSVALNMIIQDPPAVRVWTQQDFNASGWTTVNDVKEVSPDLVPALQGLGVPHAAERIHPVFADQHNNYTDRNGRQNTVSILKSRPHSGTERFTHGTMLFSSGYLTDENI